MAEKTLNTRIQLKHDTAENWSKATNFIPKPGEMIIYDADINYNYSRTKIGDGRTPVETLPFMFHKKEYYGLIEDEGDIVSADCLEGTGIKAESYISAYQEGTGAPSPDNIRPIVGWDAITITRAGKNLLGFNDYNIPTTSGVYTDSCTNGVFKREILGTHSTTYVIGTTAMVNIINPNIKAGTYTFTLTQTAGTTLVEPYLEVTLKDGTVVNLQNGVKTTISQEGTITGVRMKSTHFSTNGIIEFVLQLEVGAATGYEPYKSVEILTIELPETVYGGSFDWSTGILTVTHKKEALTRMSATHSNAGEGYLAASVAKTDMKSNGRHNGMCETMNPVSSHSGATTNCIVFGANNQNIYIAISKELAGETRDSLNAYLAENPLVVVYELAEPYTIQLAPSQIEASQGVNTIWSDCGNTRALFNYSLFVNLEAFTDEEIDEICGANIVSSSEVTF